MNVEQAYGECERLTREQARNFFYGIRLLPPPKRRALSAVYAFARRIDDIGDGELPAQRKLIGLDEADKQLRELGGPSDDAVLVALHDAARRYDLPLDAFGDLIEGCRADVRGVSYDNYAQLEHYCRCVAGSIGRLSLAVFGSSDGVDVELADTLGVALQLTNILRDVVEDRRQDRIYLPADELRQFGCTLELDADGNLVDDRDGLFALFEYQAARAEQQYATGLRLLEHVDWRSRACCAAMAGIYHRLLRRMTLRPWLVLGTRTSLPDWEKIAVAARALTGGRP